MNRVEQAILNLALRLLDSSARELEGAGHSTLANRVRRHRRRIEKKERPKPAKLASGAGGRVLAGRVLSRTDDEHQA